MKSEDRTPCSLFFSFFLSFFPFVFFFHRRVRRHLGGVSCEIAVALKFT